MFKKKFKNFMCNLGKLFTFSFGFLGLFGLIVLLGGWSIDNNGNLQSQNEYSGDTQVVVSTGSNWTSKRFDITLTPNTVYTISYNYSRIGNSVNYVTIFDGTRDVLQMLDLNAKTFNTSNQSNYVIYFHASTSTGANQIGTSTYSNIMINKGNTALPYEPFGTWYSQNNYEILENDISHLNDEIGELEEQISNLQDNIDLLEKSNLIYWIINNADAYMFNINPHNSNNSNYDINYFYNNRDDALYHKRISFDPLDNIYSLENFSFEINQNNPFENDNPSQQYQVLFVLANPCNTTLVFNLFDGTYDFGITALYNNGMIQNFDNEKISNYYVHVPFDVENDNSIIAFKVNFYWEDYKSIQLMIKSDNATIQTYYDRGYYKAYNEYNSLYQRTLVDLNNANNTISSLNDRISQLNEQLDNTIGWKPFIFTMADTPFRVVSNVLGFEVFGVNLYKVLVGLITTLAIIWLIRKLRK